MNTPHKLFMLFLILFLVSSCNSKRNIKEISLQDE